MAFDVRLQLRTALEAELLSAFEQAFDAMQVGDVTVRIPQLVLDLKLRDGDDMLGALRAALAEALPERLRECIVTHPERAGVTRHTARADRHLALTSYLRSGRISRAHVLPEQESGRQQQVLQEALHEWLERLVPREIVAELLRESTGMEHAQAMLFRLLQLLPTVQRVQFVDTMIHELRSRVDSFAPFAESTTTLSGMSQHMSADQQRELAAVLMRELAAAEQAGEQLRLRAMALAILAVMAPSGIDIALARVLRDALNLSNAALPDVLRQRFVSLLVQLQVGATSKPVHAPRASVQEQEGPRVTRVERSSPPRISDDPETTLGWTAADAGLVLLHPFLTRFFAAVGLVTNEQGRIPDAELPRAAALLHWLMSGRDAIHEFELTTIKLLLGLEPDSVLLVSEGLLSDDDRAEADALLEAVIAHWGALGKTGVAGLRISFLQRRGLLRRNERGWQLQVEPESFDMLLGKLPWGISIVKLPWMTRPIFTEWPTP